MIRERTDSDLPACVAALRLVHERDRYPHRWPVDPTDWLSPPRQRQAWVAVGNEPDEIAGHVALNVAEGGSAVEVWTTGTDLPPDRLLVVSRLFVSVGFRRAGVARELLDHATAHAHGLHLQPVLDVLEADRAAIALYDNSGWQRIGSIMFSSRQGGPLPGYAYAGPRP
jgi:GNAT superfamily N-acetyltransferase